MTQDGAIADVALRLSRRREPLSCAGLSGSQRAYFLARLFEQARRSFLVVTPTEKEAELLARDLEFFLSAGRPENEESPPVLPFPPYHILPFKHMRYHGETASLRLEALYRLSQAGAQSPVVAVACAAAAMVRTIPRPVLTNSVDLVMAGEELDRDLFLSRLAAMGYSSTLVVEEPGEFCVRGGIVDVYAAPNPDPVRLELDGEKVISIRSFSPATQRTIRKLDEAVILPATEAVVAEGGLTDLVHRLRERALGQGLPIARVREMVEQIKSEGRLTGLESYLPLVYGQCGGLLDYLPPSSLLVLVEPAQVRSTMEETAERLAVNAREAAEAGRLVLPPHETHQTADEFFQSAQALNPLELSALGGTEPAADTSSCWFSVQGNAALAHTLSARRNREQPMASLVQWAADRRAEGCAPVLVCKNRTQAERLWSLLLPYGLDMERGWPGQGGNGRDLYVMIGRLSGGFVWPAQGLAVATEAEIFGGRGRKAPAPSKPRPRTELLNLSELRQGDYVVHEEHGVARYDGLAKMEAGGVAGDFLLLAFKDGDRLYVPVDRIHLVQKYRGVEGRAPALDRLGGKTWEQVKKRVKRSVEKIAGELLKLYAERKVRRGYPFSPADSFFKEFEAGFEYEETPDQMRTIAEVLEDMERDTPMDRLVCGDVGYGKTEVALRASFKAVSDGKQVAFIAPTTILTEQHFKTFCSRFANYPVRVECLNRFRSPAEQKRIVKGLADGSVDIVVGTHRLLQKDIRFKDLQLVIVDEEHRFGVKHKEQLKKLRSTVDFLALTATPIPRTLHMSLTGIRDISVINTPPEHRRPITTYVCAPDRGIIKEAVERELSRGGQVFYVHNRVQSIHRVADTVAELVPEARVAVAHGQMAEDRLEKVMVKFVDQEVDVLVCTTIIESGLDIPAANTILIDRADTFGLAQMYQLRGRVGRGDEQAYAYLFIPDEAALTTDATKRLKVLMEHSDLGAGFQIAMSDLTIRGGGTILGSAQSGHVAAVGYEMYLKLMESAVAELKGEDHRPPPEPEINVDFPAFFPESYIPDVDQRLAAYRRLARMEEPREVGAFKEEITDRFGRLPGEATGLLYKIMLRTSGRAYASWTWPGRCCFWPPAPSTRQGPRPWPAWWGRTTAFSSSPRRGC
ncbi:MAG: transcription-repair coupling factor [Deltaproteobacteria bacterium]|nr:transcription-repair coupling factor [Deltaproteobacteria bacterium]